MSYFVLLIFLIVRMFPKYLKYHAAYHASKKSMTGASGCNKTTKTSHCEVASCLMHAMY